MPWLPSENKFDGFSVDWTGDILKLDKTEVAIEVEDEVFGVDADVK